MPTPNAIPANKDTSMNHAHDNATREGAHRTPVRTEAKPDILRRLAYIEGHLQGVRRMIEADQYCVDVLKQTYAVRRAIDKLEGLILENHLQGCVIDGIKNSREDETVSPVICTSRVLPICFRSNCCTQVLSGRRREMSST